MTDNVPRRDLEKLYRMRSASHSGSGGGGSRNPGLYHLSMYAGLVTFTALGWRIAAELGRIRRRLS